MAVEQFSDLCNSILSIGPGKVRIIVVPEKICRCGDLYFGPGEMCFHLRIDRREHERGR